MRRNKKEDISREELAKVIKNLKRGKAAGEDGLTTEFIKGLPAIWLIEMHEILNGFWKEGKVGNGWGKARIYPMHKGGEEEDTGNYIGVSLLDIGYKLLTTIMHRRLRAWLEKKGLIRESQAGFREGRSTRDHVFVLNSTINNKLKREGGKLYGIFVDFQKAFDTVDRNILIGKLKKIRIRGRMLRMLEEICGKTVNEVITGQGITEFLYNKSG
ncbi:uncharacterized protein LOC117178983 [Belonocnema kinseyi]|uniref:uncharacterized protein LOC117178983 n=1 Tax=Belonocnema kinseyi TaxID=2817044 RepID=UPI00143D1C18|nr:uncharacterized protein LOC117178983 [Belonocnema kinseyi]